MGHNHRSRELLRCISQCTFTCSQYSPGVQRSIKQQLNYRHLFLDYSYLQKSWKGWAIGWRNQQGYRLWYAFKIVLVDHCWFSKSFIDCWCDLPILSRWKPWQKNQHWAVPFEDKPVFHPAPWHHFHWPCNCVRPKGLSRQTCQDVPWPRASYCFARSWAPCWWFKSANSRILLPGWSAEAFEF